ncbi:uncharacterized protein TM35_000017050 [Trypanosoma theileri]|uniref:Uncharacterized protein n=1 Tax=Trypanosoma theileri TaxID=67003 RepID=A0A1X0PAA9_9TRYP|nr:uncharacterized protein TM35_000017050 [Trypanosoma theileri]ORC93828.1 hypothetical protein TM35_000017050 [Trypanosoma theileri]
MYGDAGAPKKYSTPRGVDEKSVSARVCQKCASTDHWTFECKSGAHTPRNTTTTRLSRTQMLRFGIKQKREEFVPEPTEKEAYMAQVKEVEKLLLAEAKGQAVQKRRVEQRREVKDEDINSEREQDTKSEDDDNMLVKTEKKESDE